MHAEQARQPVSVAVNVSMRQLSSLTSFARIVDSALSETGLPASLLEIEVTESSLGDDPKQVISELHSIHDMGVSIAIDDFGTGFSSLSNLVDLPIDTLKIDRSFVSACLGDCSHQNIVKAVCSLAKCLNLAVVAEGVENSAVAAYLETLGCDLLQGYHFARPLSAPQFMQLLNARDAELKTAS